MQPTPHLTPKAATQGLVSACIVTRNARESLQQYLNSIKNSAGDAIPLEIIVVDNESSDNTETMLQEHFPQAKYFYQKPGVGFSKGINLAIQNSTGEFILIATPSTEVSPGCLPRLLNFLRQSEQIGLVGPKIIHPDGSTQHSSKKMPHPQVAMLHTLYLLGWIRSSKLLDEYFLFNYESEAPLRVESLTMSLLLARRAVFENVGLLDENLFAWASDVDWCYRVEQTGRWEQWFLPTAIAIHRRSSVSKKQPFVNLKHYHRDLKVFYQKHYAWRTPWIFNLLWYILLEARFYAQVVRYFLTKESFSFY